MENQILFIENFITSHKELSKPFFINFFRAAVRNALTDNNPLKANNFAYALRELIRNILQTLAPEDNVKLCTWFKSETDNGNSSRVQKIRYAIHGGFESSYIAEQFDINVRATEIRLRDLNDELSKLTHVQPETFDLSPDDSNHFIQSSLENVYNFMKTMEKCHQAVIESIESHLDNSVYEEMIKNQIDELDILSTHTRIEDTYIEEAHVENISISDVTIGFNGIVYCELQYGSDGDVRRGDGCVGILSFPFTGDLRASIPDLNILTNSINISVDTSKWSE